MTFVGLIGQNVWSRKLRSVVTSIAVAIGVMAVLTLGVLTASLQKSATEFLKVGDADFSVAQKNGDSLNGSSKDADPAAMGKVKGELVAELMAEKPSVGDVRNIGLFGAIELVKNRETKEPMGAYLGTSPEMAKLGGFLKEKGIYAFTWRNLLHTNPPLSVTEAELREVFAIINEALAITDGFVTR